MPVPEEEALQEVTDDIIRWIPVSETDQQVLYLAALFISQENCPLVSSRLLSMAGAYEDCYLDEDVLDV